MMKLQRIYQVLGLAAVLLSAAHAEPIDDHGAASPAELAGAVKPIDVPPAPDGLLKALEAAYLSPEEAAAKRVFHGLWRTSDLEDPALRAQAALMSGAFDDPALSNDVVPADLRAEAAILTGDLEHAIALLDGDPSVRASRLRGQALELLGRFDEANKALDTAVRALNVENELTDPAVIVEGVRALAIRARLTGEPAAQHERMIRLLSKAHQQLDRFYWPALLAEAELLYEKDNGQEAQQAIQQTLALNQACAGAWRLLGEMAVNSFSFDAAEGCAQRLDRVTARISHGDEAMATKPKLAPGLLDAADALQIDRPFEDPPDADHAADAVALGDSIDAALIRARRWMRQNDPEMAASWLDRVLDNWPNQRDALALRCAVVAMSYDWQRTDESLARFDAISPGSPLALYQVGKTLSERRQYDKAEQYLDQAVARLPGWPAPVIELGLLEMQSGMDARAASVLKRATELDPYNIRARNSLRLIDELLTYDTIDTERFTIRYKPGVDVVLAHDMQRLLDTMHQSLEDIVGYRPPKRTIIELMPDSEWFAVRITGMPAIHTIAASTGPIVAMEVPKVGKKHQGEYDWMRVLRHEYGHTLTLGRTNYRIPHWFTEAISVGLEVGPRQDDRARMLADALLERNDFKLFDMEEINTAFVRPVKETDRPQAYAQGHWMWEFMVDRFGPDSIGQLMDRYAAGDREDAAMQAVFGMSRDEFVKQFRPWALAQVKSWGLDPSPSLQELRLHETMDDVVLRDQLEEDLAAFASTVALRVGDAGVRWIRPFQPTLVEPTPALVDLWLLDYPDHPNLLELRLREAFDQPDDMPKAEHIDLLERYAAARPTAPTPHRLLARYYLAQKDPSNALPHLEFLDAREQYSPTYTAELARMYDARGERERAAAAAERATIIAPFDANYRELAAAAFLKLHDLASAEHHIRALVDLEPDNPKHKQRLEAIEAMLARQGAAGGAVR
ncbi:MAG: hypothetical protein KDA20_04860 [Phycisphaerales bacterium]|nr:hypothetical protein [Phycisphaerales bacterium]